MATQSGFSLSSIPPATLLALGQAFAIPDPPDIDLAGHYDQALFHLMTYWSGVERDENGVSHLALSLKHTARLMGHAAPAMPPQVHNPTMQNALNQGATFNASSQGGTPPEQEQPPPPAGDETPPKEEVKKKPRMTPDGFVILDYQPGVHLTTDQARERAGIGKSQMARLLQDGRFVRPAGVIESAATGRFNKVYLADEIDRWKIDRNKPKKVMPPMTAAQLEARKAGLAKARERIESLQLVDWTNVENGQWWTYETTIEYVSMSRSHITKLISEGKFPSPRAKGRAPGQAGLGSALFWPQDVIDWVNKSPDAKFSRVARQQADRDGPPRTAVDGAEPEPQSVAGPEPEPDPVAAEAHDLEAWSKLGRVTRDSDEPKGWMSLRMVAAYLGTTETGVERMIRDNKFPQAHKRNPRLGIREWGARQVVKWKRDNIDAKELVK